MIKDPEERTRAFIRALQDIIEETQERIQNVGGTYVAGYTIDEGDGYDVFCSSCNDYLYSEELLIDVPNIGVQCHSCSMTLMDKERKRQEDINSINRQIDSLVVKRADLMENAK